MSRSTLEAKTSAVSSVSAESSSGDDLSASSSDLDSVSASTEDTWKKSLAQHYIPTVSHRKRVPVYLGGGSDSGEEIAYYESMPSTSCSPEMPRKNQNSYTTNLYGSSATQRSHLPQPRLNSMDTKGSGSNYTTRTGNSKARPGKKKPALHRGGGNSNASTSGHTNIADESRKRNYGTNNVDNESDYTDCDDDDTQDRGASEDGDGANDSCDNDDDHLDSDTGDDAYNDSTADNSVIDGDHSWDSEDDGDDTYEDQDDDDDDDDEDDDDDDDDDDVDADDDDGDCDDDDDSTGSDDNDDDYEDGDDDDEDDDDDDDADDDDRSSDRSDNNIHSHSEEEDAHAVHRPTCEESSVPEDIANRTTFQMHGMDPPLTVNGIQGDLESPQSDDPKPWEAPLLKLQEIFHSSAKVAVLNLAGIKDETAQAIDQSRHWRIKDDFVQLNVQMPSKDRPMDETCYFTDGKRPVDFVLVFQRDSHYKKEVRNQLYRNAFEAKLIELGMELEHIYPEDSNISNTGVVKLHATWKCLTYLAEVSSSTAPIAECDIRSKGGIFEKLKKILSINIDNLMSREIAPIQYFHARFERKYENSFLIQSKESFFTRIQRLRLVAYVLERTAVSEIKRKKRWRFGGRPGGKKSLQQLMEKGVYSTWYPLHDSSLAEADLKKVAEAAHYTSYISIPLRVWLWTNWGSYRNIFKPQPLTEIREYFGEQIGIYFAWLGFYTKMLLPASILGTICLVDAIAEQVDDPVVFQTCSEAKYGNTVMCRSCPEPYCPYKLLKEDCINARFALMSDTQLANIYAVFICIWSIVFMELWTRREYELAAQWNVLGAKDQSALRAEYRHKVQSTRVDPVTGQRALHFAKKERIKRLVISITCVLSLFTVILSVMGGIQIYKRVAANVYYNLGSKLINMIGPTIFASITGSIMNAIFIATTNFVYSKMAWQLTRYEFPRTQEDFDRSYTYKVVMFQFINFYGLLFYMAVLKGKFFTTPDTQTDTTDVCPPSGCITEVLIQLIIIMTGNQVLNNVVEIGMPYIKILLMRYKTKRRKSPTGSSIKRTSAPRWEEDYHLVPMDHPACFGDYLEMTIQYGFLTVFATAFPFASFLALLNNILEIRIDAQKYLQQTQRLRPYIARNIGPWRRILRVITTIAVFTNACILAFTSKFVDRLVYYYLTIEGNAIAGACANYTDYGEGLDGFVNWRMTSFNTSHYGSELLQFVELKPPTGENDTTNVTDETVGFCRYVGHYEYHPETEEYVPCLEWWIIIVSKLGFVVVFGHAMILLQLLIAYLIPDVPRSVQQRMDRQRRLCDEMFWSHEKLELDNSKKELRRRSRILARRMTLIQLNQNTNAGLSNRDRSKSDKARKRWKLLWRKHKQNVAVTAFSHKMSPNYIDSFPAARPIQPEGRAKFDKERTARNRRIGTLALLRYKLSNYGIIC